MMNAMTHARDSVPPAEDDHGNDHGPIGMLPPPAPLFNHARPALFLDFDGTLVDIAAHPDGVEIAPGLARLLGRLAERLEGRLAVVTGRSLAALERLLGPLAIAVAGSHGGEFRPAGAAQVQPIAAPFPDPVTARVQAFAADHGGLLVEPKPYSLAVHYRHHPAARDALLALGHALARDHGLGLTHGKQVVELASAGADKGSAIGRFMALSAFAGSLPLFLGDDTTDEHGFAAVLPLGGGGVLVGPQRETAALWRLDDVPAVHAWLKEALA